jgi:hypothetical protein
MVQAYDMKRLHMGCGESLRAQFSPFTFAMGVLLPGLETLLPKRRKGAPLLRRAPRGRGKER